MDPNDITLAYEDSITRRLSVEPDGSGRFTVESVTRTGGEEELAYTRESRVSFDPAQRAFVEEQRTERFSGLDYDPAERPASPAAEALPLKHGVEPSGWRAYEETEVNRYGPAFSEQPSAPAVVESSVDRLAVARDEEALARSDLERYQRTEEQRYALRLDDGSELDVARVREVSYLDDNRQLVTQTHLEHNPDVSAPLVLRDEIAIRDLLRQQGVTEGEAVRPASEGAEVQSTQVSVNGPLAYAREVHVGLDAQGEELWRRENERVMVSSERGLEVAWAREREYSGGELTSERSVVPALENERSLSRQGPELGL